jgi:Tfp pilus assembly protein PilF
MYEKAISLNKSEPIYFTELDLLYELANAPISTRVKLFEGNSEVVEKRDDAFIRQIAVLTLSGNPEKSAEYLKGKSFNYREGNSRVREVIIDANLMLGLKYMAAKDYKNALAQFLEAQIPDEEAGSARSGNRDIQVNYYIGLAYEALHDNVKSKAYYKKSAEHSISKTGYMRYYQGLSYSKLGNKTKANEIFDSLVADGKDQINNSGTKTDFFAIFGEREAENALKSQAYTMRGLGYKGLGQTEQANADLSKAVELSFSNLWANALLKNPD